MPKVGNYLILVGGSTPTRDAHDSGRSAGNADVWWPRPESGHAAANHKRMAGCGSGGCDGADARAERSARGIGAEEGGRGVTPAGGGDKVAGGDARARGMPRGRGARVGSVGGRRGIGRACGPVEWDGDPSLWLFQGGTTNRFRGAKEGYRWAT